MSEVAIYRPPRRRSELQGKPSALKIQHPELQNMNFFLFSFFLSFLPSWIWIRIQPTKINANLWWSGSRTLVHSQQTGNGCLHLYHPNEWNDWSVLLDLRFITSSCWSVENWTFRHWCGVLLIQSLWSFILITTKENIEHSNLQSNAKVSSYQICNQIVSAQNQPRNCKLWATRFTSYETKIVETLVSWHVRTHRVLSCKKWNTF